MLYCCETCGKQYNTEEKALECERVHKEEKARLEELAKEKEERLKKIESMARDLENEIDDFYDDYDEYPSLKDSFVYNSPMFVFQV